MSKKHFASAFVETDHIKKLIFSNYFFSVCLRFFIIFFLVGLFVCLFSDLSLITLSSFPKTERDAQELYAGLGIMPARLKEAENSCVGYPNFSEAPELVSYPRKAGTEKGRGV